MREDLHAQMVAGIAVLTEHSDRGVVEERDGVTVTSVGRGDDEFNTAWVGRVPSDPAATGSWCLETLRATGRPHMMQIPAPMTEALMPALRAADYRRVEQVPAMELLIGAASTPALPHGLTATVVEPDEFDRWLTAVAIGFGAPGQSPDPEDNALPSTLIDDPRIACVQVHQSGHDEPVGTAVAVLWEHTAGIYAVTTHPEHRRQGIGAAATWAAIGVAAERGATHAFLQATAMGEPVYRRMGFETLVAYDRFAPAN